MVGNADVPTAEGTFLAAMMRTGPVSYPFGALYTVASIAKLQGRHCTDKLLSRARNAGAEKSRANQDIRQGKHNGYMTWTEPFRFELFDRAPILPTSLGAASAVTEIDKLVGLIPSVQEKQVDLAKSVAIAGNALGNAAAALGSDDLPPGDRCAPYIIANHVALAVREILTEREIEISRRKRRAGDEHPSANELRIAILDQVIARAGGESRLRADADLLAERSEALWPEVEAVLLDRPASFGDDPRLARRLAEGWLIFTVKLRMAAMVRNPATVEDGGADAAFENVRPEFLAEALAVFDLVHDDSTARRLLAIAERRESSLMAFEVLSRLIRLRGSESIWFNRPLDWQARSWSLLDQDIFARAFNRVWQDPLTGSKLEALLTPGYVAKMTKDVGDRLKKHPALVHLKGGNRQ